MNQTSWLKRGSGTRVLIGSNGISVGADGAAAIAAVIGASTAAQGG